MNTIEALIASGAMALAPYTNTWTPMPWVPTNWVKVDREGHILPPNAAPFASDMAYPPGTPVEGSKLTTETKELKPCFAAPYLACPGHWETNRTVWVYKAGNWVVEPQGFVGATNTVAFSNVMVLKNRVFLLPGTNRWTTSAADAADEWAWSPVNAKNESSLLEVGTSIRSQRLEIEALEKQVEFWKEKALGVVR